MKGETVRDDDGHDGDGGGQAPMPRSASRSRSRSPSSRLEAPVLRGQRRSSFPLCASVRGEGGGGGGRRREEGYG